MTPKKEKKLYLWRKSIVKQRRGQQQQRGRGRKKKIRNGTKSDRERITVRRGIITPAIARAEKGKREVREGQESDQG